MTWRQDGLRYRSLGHYFRGHFGSSVRKISLDMGLPCPHRTAGGCIFCNTASFSPQKSIPQNVGGSQNPVLTLGANLPQSQFFDAPQYTLSWSIHQQLESGIAAVRPRPQQRYIAYFQTGTNTVGPLSLLRDVFFAAARYPNVVGIAIGTRPDCVPNDVLDLIAELAETTWVCLELGLQSPHDTSLQWLRRGHRFSDFTDAVHRSTARDIRICAHLILDIPAETAAMRLTTAKIVAELPLFSVKLHNLYVAKDTDLETLWKTEWQTTGITLPSLAEYARMVVDFLEWMPPDMVIERTSSTPVSNTCLAPLWVLDKTAVHTEIAAEFHRRDSYQGCQNGSR